MTLPDSVDVAVVGAGPAGVGIGTALSFLDVETVILERDAVGASFRNWPAEMRFITPSFPSNGFGHPDLNAVVPATSPGAILDTQQPSGDEYAEYLQRVVDHYELPVETGIEVTTVTPLSDAAPESGGPAVSVPRGVAVDGGDTEGFRLETSGGSVHAQCVVWAGGQFGTPRTDVFSGAALCVHNAAVDSWADHAAANSTDEFLVVGGFESGIDAAVNLVELGCSVTVLDRGHPWATRHPDPSQTLSPYTLQRLDEVRDSEKLTLVGGAEVQEVHRTDDGQFSVHARPVGSDPVSGAPPTANAGWEDHSDGTFVVPTRPILATGFDSDFGPVEELFPRERGSVRLTERDESPTTPGLFLTGPEVEHNGQKFCFIYKFRARLPVVAEEIGERLGVATEPLDQYREAGMFLDDLDCCEPVDCNC